MLVLSRREQESLLIGGNRVTITRIAKTSLTIEVSEHSSGKPSIEHKIAFGERQMLATNVAITYVDHRADPSGDRARIGIEAPMEVPVHRGEIFDAIARSNPNVQLDAPGT